MINMFHKDVIIHVTFFFAFDYNMNINSQINYFKSTLKK